MKEFLSGKSHNQIARETGLAVSVVYRALTGRGGLTLDTAMRICHALNITVEQFFEARKSLQQDNQQDNQQESELPVAA